MSQVPMQRMLQQVQCKRTGRVGTVIRINDASQEVVLGYVKLATGKFDYKDKVVVHLNDLIERFIKL